MAEHYFRKVEMWVRFPPSALELDFQIKHRRIGERLAEPPIGFVGGNQWDALRVSHALGSSVSFSTKPEYLHDCARTHFIKNS